MEALISINLVYLELHPETPKLTSSAFGVVYGRTNDWLSIPALYARRFGDCKSLTAMRVAEHRIRGKNANPVFRSRKNETGGTDFHILVQIGVDSFEDPSKECGMGANEWAYFSR